MAETKATLAGPAKLAASITLVNPELVVEVLAITRNFVEQLYGMRGELNTPVKLEPTERVVGALVSNGDCLVRDMSTGKVRLVYAHNLWLGLGGELNQASMRERDAWLETVPQLFLK